MGRHVLRRRSVAWIVCALALLALPGPAAAALDDSGDWVPGSLLMKFDTQDRARVERFLGGFGATLVRPLPLIPGGYEVKVEGKLQEAIDAAFLHSLVNRDSGGVQVEWAQPNYFLHLKYFAAPTDKAYWPNDPAYWPYKPSTPSTCPGNQAALDQAGLWPLDANLNSTVGDWVTAAANPLPANLRQPAVVQSGFGLARTSQSSINVLPVWNALAESFDGTKRTAGPRGIAPNGGSMWTNPDLRRSGIAVLDSGLSNAPDVAGQAYGLISVGRRRTAEPARQFSSERITYIYAHGGVIPHDDLDAINAAVPGVGQELAGRQTLIPLDDLGSLPYNEPSDLTHPNGCDGHGTEVASVAAGTAGNGIGIAGVGWNVPVLGIRPGAPVLDTPLTPELIGSPGTLIAESRKARPVELSDASMIDAFGIVKALGAPVLNLSWGAQLFATGVGQDKRDLIVTSPAVVEALGRLLSSGKTLGVAAAGPGKYGAGVGARGALTARGDSDAVQFPCGLRTLSALGPKVLAGTQDPRPFASGVSWTKLSLLCVTGTYPQSAKLIRGAGGGESAVDLAAPGLTTVATRPTSTSLTRPEPPFVGPGTYRVATGTSFAAAMVSGAAALLREVAPGAEPRTIMQALRVGAYADIRLRLATRYGQLNVACSALWLAQNAGKHPDWNVRITAAQLAGPYTKNCFQPGAAIGETTWSLPKSYFDAGGTTTDDKGLSLVGVTRKGPADKLPERVIGREAAAGALGIQAAALEAGVVTWNARDTAFFPIGTNSPITHPQPPPTRDVYYFGGQTAPCPPGAGLGAVLSTRWEGAVHPQGYLLFSQRADLRRTTFLVALVKPWYSALLPSTMRIAVKVLCLAAPPEPR